MGWFGEIRKDMTKIVPAIEYYEQQLSDAKMECSLRGSVEKHGRDIPGIVEYRFGQLQEIEAILEYLNIETKKLKTEKYRQYLENYNRALSSRDAEKYADGDAAVVDQQHIVNEFAFIRNKYMGLIKALDAKQFQINNIIKLRVAGLDDLSL